MSEWASSDTTQNMMTDHGGKDTTHLYNTTTNNSGSWNSGSSYGGSVTMSESHTKYASVADIVAKTTGYGKSYISSNNSENTEGHSSTSSESQEYGLTTTYSTKTEETVTSTWTTLGTKPGYHRWVVAGTMHVFGVVGYNYRTKSFYVNCYSVLDDERHEFEDYSYTTSEYNDNQYGIIPFEAPTDILDYIADKTDHSSDLVIDQATGTVTSYNGEGNLVVIPELYPVYSHTENGVAHYDNVRINGISSSAFRGNTNIHAVILPKTVKSIPDGAFEGCTNLGLVNAPSVTSIGSNAFNGCDMMEVAVVSANVTSLGTNAYGGINYLYVGLANADVAEAAAQAGAKHLIMYTNDLADHLDQFNGRTIHVPSTTEYFEFNGENQIFNNFKVISDAQKTVLNKAKFANCMQLPLIISSPAMILNQVDVSSKGTALALTADSANLAMQSTINLTTDIDESMIARSLTLSASKPDVLGTLSVSGNLNTCGAISGTGHLAKGGSEIVEITDERFNALLNASLVLLDPNGGTCDVDYVLVEGGQTGMELPVATRMGYVFTGWYLPDGTPLTESGITAGGTVTTAVAGWTPEQYTISWKKDVGEIITVNRTASYVDGVTLGELASGDPIYYGDTLSVTYGANTGFTLLDHGEESITVTTDVTSSEIYANVKVNAYKVSWSTGTGYTITVKRTSSPYQGAATGNLSNNAAVYYGDTLAVTYTAATNYRLKTKGKTSITVSGNVTSSDIYATAELNTKLIKSSDYTVGSVRSHLELYTLNNASGVLYLKGWIYDTANPSATLRLDVDSQYAIEGNKPSPSCPVGGNHGFEAICTDRGVRVRIHTWSAAGGSPLLIWDTWIDYSNATYYSVVLAP